MKTIPFELVLGYTGDQISLSLCCLLDEETQVDSERILEVLRVLVEVLALTNLG